MDDVPVDQSGLDYAAISTWTERNRLAREEYYSNPGPFPCDEGVPLRLVDHRRGISPPTIRQVLETTLDDLWQAQATVARQVRLTSLLTREIIDLKGRLGEEVFSDEKRSLHALWPPHPDDGAKRN